jgi:hypothetical protein
MKEGWRGPATRKMTKVNVRQASREPRIGRPVRLRYQRCCTKGTRRAPRLVVQHKWPGIDQKQRQIRFRRYEYTSGRDDYLLSSAQTQQYRGSIVGGNIRLCPLLITRSSPCALLSVGHNTVGRDERGW